MLHSYPMVHLVGANPQPLVGYESRFKTKVIRLLSVQWATMSFSENSEAISTYHEDYWFIWQLLLGKDQWMPWAFSGVHPQAFLLVYVSFSFFPFFFRPAQGSVRRAWGWDTREGRSAKIGRDMTAYGHLNKQKNGVCSRLSLNILKTTLKY